MTERFLPFLEKYKKDFDNISLHITQSRSRGVQLDGYEVETAEVTNGMSVAVRAVQEGRSVSCVFTGADDDALHDFLQNSAQTIGRLPADECRLIPEYTYTAGTSEPDGRFQSVTMAELTDMAKELTSAAVNHDKRVKAVKQSHLSASIIKNIMLSTAGPVLENEQTYFSSSAYLIAADADERDAYESSLSTTLAGLDYRQTGILAAENACSLLGAKQINTGSYSIVFSAGVMAEFIELLLNLTDGDNVYKGLSMLAGRLGERVSSEIFTLTDDPLVKGGAGSRDWDDEGQVCKKIHIFKNGVLESFLHNSYTAKSLSMENNARGVLSGGNIAVGNTNVILHPSTSAKPQDVCRDFLKITEVMGMHTADPVSGDFSVGVSGIYYIDGTAAYPFKEAVLSGNLSDLLQGCTHVFAGGRTYGNITASDALFDKMTVSGV